MRGLDWSGVTVCHRGIWQKSLEMLEDLAKVLPLFHSVPFFCMIILFLSFCITIVAMNDCYYVDIPHVWQVPHVWQSM